MQKKYSLEFHFTVKDKADLPLVIYIYSKFPKENNINFKKIELKKSTIYLNYDKTLSHTMYTFHHRLSLDLLDKFIKGLDNYLKEFYKLNILRIKVEAPAKSDIEKYEYIEIHDVLSSMSFDNYKIVEYHLKFDGVHMPFTNNKIFSTSRTTNILKRNNKEILELHLHKLLNPNVVGLIGKPKSKMEKVIYDNNIYLDREWMNV